MPVISSFYGILIKMYFGDHVPPHFHAEYAEFTAQISIVDFGIIGRIPAAKSIRSRCRMGEYT